MTIETALIIVIVLLVLILIVTLIHAKASIFWTREILKYAKEQQYAKPNSDLQKLLDKREYSKIVSEVTEKRLTNTNDPALYWYKGLALFHLDNWDEAKTVLRHAIQMEPSYENKLSPYLKRIESQDAPNKSLEQPGLE